MNYTVVFLVVACMICLVASLVVVMNKRWFAKAKTIFGTSLQTQANCAITTQEKELLDIIDGKSTCNLGGKCFGDDGVKSSVVIRFTSSNEGVAYYEIPRSISFQYSTGTDPKPPDVQYEMNTQNFNYSIYKNEITLTAGGKEIKGTISVDNGILKLKINGSILTPITSWSIGSGNTMSCS